MPRGGFERLYGTWTRHPDYPRDSDPARQVKQISDTAGIKVNGAPNSVILFVYRSRSRGREQGGARDYISRGPRIGQLAPLKHASALTAFRQTLNNAA